MNTQTKNNEAGQSTGSQRGIEKGIKPKHAIIGCLLIGLVGVYILQLIIVPGAKILEEKRIFTEDKAYSVLLRYKEGRSIRLQYLPIFGFLFFTARHIVVETNSQTHVIDDSVDAWDGISLDNFKLRKSGNDTLEIGDGHCRHSLPAGVMQMTLFL